MEQIIDNLSLWALQPDLFGIRGAHVSHNRLETSTTVGTQEGEEGTQVFPPTAAPYPEHALGRWINHDCGVAMPTLDRELVYSNDSNRAKVNGPKLVSAATTAGLDTIHFELSVSENGSDWTTTRKGDEVRQE